MITLTAILIASCARSASASGDEWRARADDLELVADSRWCGTAHGGYYPIRFRVLNKGPERTFTFRFTGRGEAMPTVSRSVTIAQNATARFTLSIPVVSSGTYGQLDVLRDGRPIGGLSETLAIPDVRYDSEVARPALLVISASNVDPDAFEEGVEFAALSVVDEGGYWSGYGYSGGVSSDHQIIDPAMLPDSWIDYSGIDLVAIDYETLARLEGERRSAILDWVHTGGTLIVTETGSDLANPELNGLLGFDRHAAIGVEWKPADVKLRKSLNTSALPGAQEFNLGGTTSTTKSDDDDAAWDDEPFFSRNLMIGNVYAFPGQAFPGTSRDWAWFVRSLDANQATWTARHGMSSRAANHEFLKFLIPSVRGVPVGAFLILISLFSFVIGPLNYIWLWRRRRLYLMIFTIPLIAFGTSIALFAYSALAHGFSVRSRIYSLTMLDQPAGTAVTYSRTSLYSGIAPSDGLRFSPETAVYPVWPPQGGFRSGSVDWSQTQHWESGWLRARTRTQFLTTEHTDQRGRLEFTADGDTLHAANGLEWDLAALLAADGQGRIFYSEQLPAGSSSALSQVTTNQGRQFAAMIGDRAPGVPGFLQDRSASPFDTALFYEADDYSGVSASFRDSIPGVPLRHLQQAADSDFQIPKRSYAAILAENPEIDTGLESTREEASLHIVVGYY